MQGILAPARRRHHRAVAAAAPTPITSRLLTVWAGFCLLMVLVGLQERWYAGQALWPWPLFYELSSMAVATLVAAWRWRRSARDDAWLGRPLQWFWRVLRWTPLVALAFVPALYGLRHAVGAAFGLPCEHPPWPEVLAYEMLKFAVFYLLFAGITFALHSHEALAAERLRAEQLERLSGEARLAHLEPPVVPALLVVLHGAGAAGAALAACRLGRPGGRWPGPAVGLAAAAAAGAGAGPGARAAVPALRRDPCAGRRLGGACGVPAAVRLRLAALARRRRLLPRLQALRRPALALALAGWAVLVGYPALVSGWPAVPQAWRLPMRWAFAAAQCGGIVAAFGFARAHLNIDHRWRAPLTEAVFSLYLVHQTVLILAAVALRPLALPAGLEATLIIGITFGGGFLAWQLARRIGWLRPWMGLAARRAARPWPCTAPARSGGLRPVPAGRPVPPPPAAGTATR